MLRILRCTQDDKKEYDCHSERSEESAGDEAQKGLVLLNVNALLLCCRPLVALRMTKKSTIFILNGMKNPQATKHKKEWSC